MACGSRRHLAADDVPEGQALGEDGAVCLQGQDNVSDGQQEGQQALQIRPELQAAQGGRQLQRCRPTPQLRTH